jgi:hypothetical protein
MHTQTLSTCVHLQLMHFLAPAGKPPSSDRSHRPSAKSVHTQRLSRGSNKYSVGNLLDAFSKQVLGSSHADEEGAAQADYRQKGARSERDAEQSEWAQIVHDETEGSSGAYAGDGDAHSGEQSEEGSNSHDDDFEEEEDDDNDNVNDAEDDVDQRGGESARRSLEGTLKGLRETQGQLKNLVRRAHALQKAQTRISGVVKSGHVQESQDVDDDGSEVQNQR